MGLRFGGGGSYQICGGFSVVSAIHFAAVFGKYSNKNNRTIPLLDVSNLQDGLGIQSALYQTAFNEYYLVTMTEKYRNFSSNVVLDLGIGWEDCCEKVGFRLKVAYEIIYWWDLAIYRQGLAGDTAVTSNLITNSDFLFAGTSPTTKFNRELGFQGLVVSLDLVF